MAKLCNGQGSAAPVWRQTWLPIAVLSVLWPLTAGAEVVTFENFESYGSDAALAAAWPDVISAPVQTLETVAPINGAKSMRLAYDVSDGTFQDGVQRTFASDQDWSLFTTLRIFYRVEPGSSDEDIVVDLLDNADVVLGSRAAPGGTGVSEARWEVSLFLGFLNANQDLQQVRKVRLRIRDGGDSSGTGAVIFDDMSVSSGTYSTCRPCHGEFDDSPYVSLADGQLWSMGLHGTHVPEMLNNDCLACHVASAPFPVFVDISEGGVGLPPVSCMGCHGREADKGHDAVSPGRGLGLRQHHVQSGVAACGTCHTDSDSQVFPAVSEKLAPPYYFTPDAAHPNKPINACTDAERFVSTTEGLDNDGDLLYESADPDCGVFVNPAPAPALAWPGLFGGLALLIGVAARRLGFRP